MYLYPCKYVRMVLKKRPPMITVCYLCGRPLAGQKADKDHVPPDRWIAKNFKVGAGPQLLTLPVHERCQNEFEDDEVYFFNTLLPLAAGSAASDEALKDLGASFRHPEQKALGIVVLNEFGKVITSDGKLLKSYLPSRVNRVIWKVVRGLFFVEYDGRVLPESTPRKIEIISPEEVLKKLPPEFPLVRDTASRGRYPGAFDYKYVFCERSRRSYVRAALLVAAFMGPDHRDRRVSRPGLRLRQVPDRAGLNMYPFRARCAL